MLRFGRDDDGLAMIEWIMDGVFGLMVWGFGVWCWYLRSKRVVLFLVVMVCVYVVIG